MKTVSVFVYPDRLCIASIKSPGKKPRYAQPQWVEVESGKALLEEPIQLASLIREHLGDTGRCDVCLCLWPEAYSTVMFSHGKLGKRDIKRQRMSELDTVFHGNAQSIYATDFLMDGGKRSFDGKARRIIYAIRQQRADLLREAFKASNLHIHSIAPMNAAFAESALQFCNLEKKEITAVLMLDDACTELALIHNGRIQMIRPIPQGGSAVLAAYRADMPELTNEQCRLLIRIKGMSDDDTLFNKYPILRDKVLNLANRISNEIIKSVRSIYGETADVDKLLICGGFADIQGLSEHFTSHMQIPCVSLKSLLPAKAAADICLREEDLPLYFPFASVAQPQNDLLSQWRKMVSDRRRSIAASIILVLVAGVLACGEPYLMHQLRAERDASAVIIEQPEYVAVHELLDQRSAVTKKKSALEEAIANLPHGETNVAGIITDLNELSKPFGKLSTMSVDYSAKTVRLSFTTESYNNFVSWQNKITEGGRFSFVTPPTFSGDEGNYSVGATIRATDFEEQVKEEVQP